MIKFSKYHGCGNSFMISEEKYTTGEDLSRLAVRACEAEDTDGMIIVRTEPELEMIFYNRDGSRAPMCGNGIRCFAHYCRDNRIAMKREYPVRTLAGDMVVNIINKGEDGETFKAQINMGHPDLASESCAIDTDKGTFLGEMLDTDYGQYEVNSVFMGTIHTVVWVADFDFPYEKVGEQLSNHPVYKEKTNVNFVRIHDDSELEIKTYERGVGMTLACGTGACASFVVARLQGKCAAKISAQLPGGTLEIEGGTSGIMMTGPSVRVKEGIMVE